MPAMFIKKYFEEFELNTKRCTKGRTVTETDIVIHAIPELAIPPVWLAVIWWNYTRPDISAWLLYTSEVNF